MSEQILERTAPSAGSTMPPMVDSGQESAPKRSRTFLIVALAIVAGLVIGGMALFLMKPAAIDEPFVPVPGGSGTTAADTQAQAEAEQAAAQAAAPTAKIRITSRDPFAPLVAKAAPAPAPAPAPVVAAAPDAASSSSSESSATSSKGGTISALAISPLGNSVKLKLDGKKYTVDEGETFAKSYRLYDIFNANCAGFLYGDQNAVVCEGDSVQVG
jgi:hypothetical protein